MYRNAAAVHLFIDFKGMLKIKKADCRRTAAIRFAGDIKPPLIINNRFAFGAGIYFFLFEF